jgi:trehalose utilization protein
VLVRSGSRSATGAGLIANFKPGHQETWVDYDNDARAATAVHRGRR